MATRELLTSLRFAQIYFKSGFAQAVEDGPHILIRLGTNNHYS